MGRAEEQGTSGRQGWGCANRMYTSCMQLVAHAGAERQKAYMPIKPNQARDIFMGCFFAIPDAGEPAAALLFAPLTVVRPATSQQPRA